MIESSNSGIDFIKEIRLRRWARENYVSPERRSPEWHAIVLEEMRQRDAELVHRTPDTLARAFVPLPPSEIRRYDEAHVAVGEPNLMNSPIHEWVDC